MDEQEFCALVYDVLTLIDGYAAKSKRGTFDTDEGWAEYVQGYASILATACVSPIDIKPAALLHVQKSKYFPSPSELIDIAKVMSHRRRIDDNHLLRALPAPVDPPSDEERERIKSRLAELETQMVWYLTQVVKRAAKVALSEHYEISPERLESIKHGRLRLEKGGVESA